MCLVFGGWVWRLKVSGGLKSRLELSASPELLDFKQGSIVPFVPSKGERLSTQQLRSRRP